MSDPHTKEFQRLTAISSIISIAAITSSPLTIPRMLRIILITSRSFGADLGFHAEWLRDEP